MAQRCTKPSWRAALSCQTDNILRPVLTTHFATRSLKNCHEKLVILRGSRVFTEMESQPQHIYYSRMRSKGSRFTLWAWELRVCSLDVAFTSATPHSTFYTLHSTVHVTLYTPHPTLSTPHCRLVTGEVRLYKTSQINYCRKVLCVTAFPCVLTSSPWTYVWAFGFVGCILILRGWCKYVSHLGVVTTYNKQVTWFMAATQL